MMNKRLTDKTDESFIQIEYASPNKRIKKPFELIDLVQDDEVKGSIDEAQLVPQKMEVIDLTIDDDDIMQEPVTLLLQKGIIPVNKPIFESEHLKIHSGQLFDIRGVDCIGVESRNPAILENYVLGREILDKCGIQVQCDLDFYFNDTSIRNKTILSYNKPAFPVTVTNTGEFKYARFLAHLHLQPYDYTRPDWTRNHFKNAIRGLLIYVFSEREHQISTLALSKFSIYPMYRVAKWLKEALDEFLVEHPATNPQLHFVMDTSDGYMTNTFINTFMHNETILDPFISHNPIDKYSLINVNSEHEEYSIVSEHFKLTMPSAKAKVLSIKKVHNEHLEFMYKQSSEVLAKRNPTDTINEYYLFHGTTASSTDSICKFGFDRSYCGKNGVYYGRGVYFARDSVYSHRFNQPLRLLHARNKFCFRIILAKVLVGQFTIGMVDKIDPGQRPDGNQYDSTVDKLDNPSIFVIYRDYRACPIYIIEYELNTTKYTVVQ